VVRKSMRERAKRRILRGFGLGKADQRVEKKSDTQA